MSRRDYQEVELLITGCDDPMMWYADKIGNRVPLLQDDGRVFLSRETGGYSNIVRREDARVVKKGMFCV